MKTWLVKYERIDDRQTRHPFFKRQETVQADTRQQALAIARGMGGYPEKYDRWAASCRKTTQTG